MKIKACLARFLPFFAMVVVSCLEVGASTIGKAAMSNGMNSFVFVAYSYCIATLLLFPFAFIFDRTKRPPLTFSILSKFFLVSLIGIAVMNNFAFAGVGYSSPTLGTAIFNLVPAFTSFFCVIFGMEKLDLSIGSMVKILGIIVSILGALIVTLYQGFPIGPSEAQPLKQIIVGSGAVGSRDWITGGVLLAVAAIAYSVRNIFQAMILKKYSSEITMLFFCCLFGSIQSTVVALVFVRDLCAWKIKTDIELMAIIYSALPGNMVLLYLQTWCIRTKGPVFVSMFTPLQIVLAVLMGVVFLGDRLYIGSVIGAVVTVSGFYGVIWAQSTEEKSNSSTLDSEKAPLIEKQAEEHV